MSDSDSQGPGREKPEGSAPSSQGAPRAYSSYEPEPAKKTGAPANLAVWVALIIASGIGFKYYAASKAPTTQITAEVSSVPAQAVAADPRADLISDFNRYMDVVEQPAAHTETASKGMELTTTPEAKQAEAKLTESANKFAAFDPNFVSLVSKCYIDGHDIHFITPDGRILNHVATGSPLAPLLSRAREIIGLNPGAGLRILVFKDKILVVGSDGRLVQEERNK